MKNAVWTVAIGAASLLVSAVDARAQSVLASPNGHVEIRFEVAANQATYEVHFNGRQVIAPSALGLEMRGGSLVEFEAIGEARSSADERYRLVVGKTREARIAYSEAVFSLRETGARARRLDVVFRAYDDGAAFRYVLPQQPNVTNVEIWGERTRFNFPRDYSCFARNSGQFGGDHEGEFDPIPASRIRPFHLLDLPLVCHDDGAAFAIVEADLENYGALYLSRPGDGLLGVNARLSPRSDNSGLAVRMTMDEDGIETPWRALMLADQPGRLIESNLIANLRGLVVGLAGGHGHARHDDRVHSRLYRLRRRQRL
jgi:alpha-glucosidase